MRFEKVGADGHVWKIVGDDDEATVLYRKNDSGSFVEAFRVGEGYIALKNTATGSLPSAPAEGALVYDSTTNAPKFHNGSSWVELDGVDDDAIHDNVSGEISALTEKSTPTSSDLLIIEDAAASNAKKKVQIGNLPTSITTGSFTPVLWDGSSDSDEGQTYNGQEGNYLKIGDLVYIHGYLLVNSIGTLTTSQTAYIGGLPFASSGLHGIQIFTPTSLNITANQVAQGFIANTNSRITLELWDATGGTTALLISELSAGANIYFSGWYKTS